MTQNNRTEHDTKVEELRARYAREGYEVLVEPRGESLPFDLGTYVPDLVAHKDSGGLIVEVKAANAKTSLERYQSVARVVQQHPGWRFLLVTVDDLNVPNSPQEMVSWDKLEVNVATTTSLIAEGHAEPATLYLWSIFEAAMRKLAVISATPIERLPATKLMNQLYTAGYISVDEFATAKKFLAMRNGITHGFGVVPDRQLLQSFLRVVSALIQEWKKEPVDEEASGE